MNINIVCIGKLKEKYWAEAVKEYSKRLKRYCFLNIKELKEIPVPRKHSDADERAVKTAEGNEILRSIRKDDYMIALEIDGEALSSEALALKINELALAGRSNIDFVIGGSLGLSDNVSNRADFKLSFSKMTFPHQMMRVILLEQIYRSFKIMRNETYHK